MKEQIDIFQPKADSDQVEKLRNQILESPQVKQVVYVDGMRSSEALRNIAASTEADFVVLIVKNTQVELGVGALERMAQVAADSGAAMVYADHWERKKIDGNWTTEKHPAIDNHKGAIPDDFDIGS